MHCQWYKYLYYTPIPRVTRFSHYARFFWNQNARYAGTRCNLFLFLFLHPCSDGYCNGLMLANDRRQIPVIQSLYVNSSVLMSSIATTYNFSTMLQVQIWAIRIKAQIYKKNAVPSLDRQYINIYSVHSFCPWKCLYKIHTKVKKHKCKVISHCVRNSK